MKTKINGEITLNVSAAKAWQILAHEFEHIERWASAIAASGVNSETIIPAGAEVGGRVCTAPGFGDIQETFTYFDEEQMRYGYRASGLPWFLTKAENNWSVRALSADRCVAQAQAEMELLFLPGLLILPIFKVQMRRLVNETMEELKYYAEQGQPHPRKLLAQQKALGRRPAHS